jgi:hypothetical protein
MGYCCYWLFPYMTLRLLGLLQGYDALLIFGLLLEAGALTLGWITVAIWRAWNSGLLRLRGALTMSGVLFPLGTLFGLAYS